jgi:hypothetical protein
MTELSTAIANMFERNLALVSLREPATTEHARARRILELLVETLGGYALGTAAGQLVRGVATWFGPDEPAALTPITPPPTRIRGFEVRDIDAPFRAIALRAEFTSALRARLSETARELDRFVDTIERLLPADRARTSIAMFSALKRESLFEDRLSCEILTGWTYACSVIERMPIEHPDTTPRARLLWDKWSLLAGGQIVKPVREPAQQGGYITRVG